MKAGKIKPGPKTGPGEKFMSNIPIAYTLVNL